jgi:hypothetical protein
MATNSKVFVSPGVYTSEVDLSFVAQSVGVTTLGIVGETLKGPAFEPIFITNFDEFQLYFGTTEPEKFVNTQIPKYEAAYIAKAYLQQSNQLFVTRVLGLSGYDAGPSWSISTVANANCSTVGIDRQSPDSATTYTIRFSGTTGATSEIGFHGTIPGPMVGNFYAPYTKFNGGTSSIAEDLKSMLLGIMRNPATTSGNTTQLYPDLPVVFTGTSLAGNLVVGTTYYLKGTGMYSLVIS